MPDRLATLLPYPAKVQAQPGQFAMDKHIPVAAGPAAQQAADAVRQMLAALPWPPAPGNAGPLEGPHPLQQGGIGPRRHRAGYLAADVTRHLAELAGGGAS
jgi:hypothetical protein